MNHLKLIFSLLAAALSCAGFPALAEYPDKPVKIIVPYPPGGTTDTLSPVIAQLLGERLKQSFIVENRGDWGKGGVRRRKNGA